METVYLRGCPRFFCYVLLFFHVHLKLEVKIYGTYEWDISETFNLIFLEMAARQIDSTGVRG